MTVSLSALDAERNADEHDAAQALACLLRHTRHPDLRSRLIHSLPELGANPELLFEQLKREPEDSVRRALILCLTEFPSARLNNALQQAVIEDLLRLYEQDADPGIHGAAEFALRRLGHAEDVSAVDLRIAA